MLFKTYDHRAKRAGGRPEPDFCIEGAFHVRGMRLPLRMHKRDIHDHGVPIIWRGRLIPMMTWVRLSCRRSHPMKVRTQKLSRRRSSVYPFDWRVGINDSNCPF